MELVDVSHNTILNDLNNIRELIEFEQFNIHLRVKSLEDIILNAICYLKFNLYIKYCMKFINHHLKLLNL